MLFSLLRLINVNHLCLRERCCCVDHLGLSDWLSILPGNNHECLTGADTFDPLALWTTPVLYVLQPLAIVTSLHKRPPESKNMLIFSLWDKIAYRESRGKKLSKSIWNLPDFLLAKLVFSQLFWLWRFGGEHHRGGKAASWMSEWWRWGVSQVQKSRSVCQRVPQQMVRADFYLFLLFWFFFLTWQLLNLCLDAPAERITYVALERIFSSCSPNITMMLRCNFPERSRLCCCSVP